MTDNKDKIDDNDLKKLDILNARPKMKTYGWMVYIPFTKAHKDFKKDRQVYDQLDLTKSQRYTQNYITKYINNVNVLIIAIITTLWTTLPQFIPSIWTSDTWSWMTLGATSQIEWSENWMGASGQAAWMFIIPSGGGFLYSKAPLLIPTLKGKFIANSIVKFLPVIILTISAVLIFQILNRRAVKHYEQFKDTTYFNTKYEKRALKVWGRL